MKSSVSTQFSDWHFLSDLKDYTKKQSENSTQRAYLFNDVVTDVVNKEPVRAIDKIDVQVIAIDEVDWTKAKQDIMSSLDWQSIQVGEPVEAEVIIKGLIDRTSVKDAMAWLYDFFLNNAQNPLLVCTLVHALSHIDYELIYPQGPMMAMAMFSSRDKRVLGFAVKAFSNWNSKDSLKYITNYHPSEKWAEKKLDRVIEYIEKYGDDLDGVFNEKNHTTQVDTRTA